MVPPFSLIRTVFNLGSMVFGYGKHGARDIVKMPVARGETILRGMFVGDNGDGEAIVATDDTGYTFVGVAVGNQRRGFVYVFRKGNFKMKATSINAGMLGTQMMVATSTSFDDNTTNDVAVGRLIKFLSSTKGWIEINHVTEPGGGPD